MSTIEVPYSSAPANRRRVWRWIALGIGAVVIVAVAMLGLMNWRMHAIPSDLDVSTNRTSAQGLYQVSYAPNQDPAALDQLHSWTLHVATPDGQPVADAIITVDGGMPQHGHGLLSQLQVTKRLGGGDYLVEGMQFPMAGWWVVDFTIDAADQPDTVRFNMIVK
jgi:hypothetical protein